MMSMTTSLLLFCAFHIKSALCSVIISSQRSSSRPTFYHKILSGGEVSLASRLHFLWRRVSRLGLRSTESSMRPHETELSGRVVERKAGFCVQAGEKWKQVCFISYCRRSQPHRTRAPNSHKLRASVVIICNRI